MDKSHVYSIFQPLGCENEGQDLAGGLLHHFSGIYLRLHFILHHQGGLDESGCHFDCYCICHCINFNGFSHIILNKRYIYSSSKAELTSENRTFF